jgi:hypothetical protein
MEFADVVMKFCYEVMTRPFTAGQVTAKERRFPARRGAVCG